MQFRRYGIKHFIAFERRYSILYEKENVETVTLILYL